MPLSGGDGGLPETQGVFEQNQNGMGADVCVWGGGGMETANKEKQDFIFLNAALRECGAFSFSFFIGKNEKRA